MQYIIKEEDNIKKIYLFKNNKRLPLRLDMEGKKVVAVTKQISYAIDIDFFCPNLVRCLNRFFMFTDNRHLRRIYFG